MAINGIAKSMLNQYNYSSSLMNLYNRQLSSGNRLVHAGVDPAGLGISSKMTSQIRGLEQAQKNIGTGQDMLKVADSGLSNINDMLAQIKELTLEAANDTNSVENRATLGQQVSDIIDEIKSTITNTEFNGKDLLSSEADKTLYLQTGANSGQGMSVKLSKLDLTALDELKAATADWGSEETIGSDISSATNMKAIDDTANAVSNNRSNLGSYINRLEHANKNVGVTIESLTEARDRITSVNELETSMRLEQEKLRQQASILMMGNVMEQQGLILNLLM